MIGDRQAPQLPLVDEGAWAYLIASAEEREAADRLRDRVVAACEESGWPALSWSPGMGPVDPGRFFEGVRHAVEHSDVVIAILDGPSAMADAELALAYGYRRPIVGIRIPAEGRSESAAQAMLENYERARVIACEDLEECVAELRALFSDPDFAAVVRMAGGEHAKDA